jgi:polyhydroxyalkanoate synthesis regulator phasin
VLDDGILKNANSFLNEYRSSIEQIMPKDEVGELPFNPLTLLDAELDVAVINIDSFAREEEKTRVVADGRKTIMNPERKGFFGFFKIWEPWEITIPIYKEEHVIEKYVEWRGFAENTIGIVREKIFKSGESAKQNAKMNTNEMKGNFREKFARLNELLRQKMAELSDMSANDKDLKMRIDMNEKLRESVEQLQKQLESILEI